MIDREAWEGQEHRYETPCTLHNIFFVKTELLQKLECIIRKRSPHTKPPIPELQHPQEASRAFFFLWIEEGQDDRSPINTLSIQNQINRGMLIPIAPSPKHSSNTTTLLLTSVCNLWFRHSQMGLEQHTSSQPSLPPSSPFSSPSPPSTFF